MNVDYLFCLYLINRFQSVVHFSVCVCVYFRKLEFPFVCNKIDYF